MNNKRWRNTRLYALLFMFLIAVGVAVGTIFLDKQPETENTWQYSQLVQAIENGQVEKVSISPDRKQAIVTTQDQPTERLVNLVNEPDLITTLSAKGVSIDVFPQGIDVLPQGDDGFWFKALSSFFFPVLLLVGLFFLLISGRSGSDDQT